MISQAYKVTKSIMCDPTCRLTEKDFLLILKSHFNTESFTFLQLKAVETAAIAKPVHDTVPDIITG